MVNPIVNPIVNPMVSNGGIMVVVAEELGIPYSFIKVRVTLRSSRAQRCKGVKPGIVQLPTVVTLLLHTIASCFTNGCT